MQRHIDDASSARINDQKESGLQKLFYAHPIAEQGGSPKKMWKNPMTVDFYWVIRGLVEAKGWQRSQAGEGSRNG